MGHQPLSEKSRLFSDYRDDRPFPPGVYSQMMGPES